MGFDFKAKNVVLSIAVRYVKTFLPNVKKPYHLKTERQTVVDINGIASKAAEYNVTTPPKVIEQGLEAGLEVMAYLAAQGYQIKTPLFSLNVRVPGVYYGHETSLPEGVHPVARLRISREFRKLIKERVIIKFNGYDETDGHIAEAYDELSHSSNHVLSRGGFLTIRGGGLKIESDTEHELQAGVYFLPPAGEPIRAPAVAVNEPKTIKLVIPNELVTGTAYRIAVHTMSSPKGRGTILKNMRNMSSNFTMFAPRKTTALK